MADSASPAQLLILATSGLSAGQLTDLAARFGQQPAVLVDLKSAIDAARLPNAWRIVRGEELLDSAAVRSDFLAFLEAWPQNRFDGQISFDESFRNVDGYSVWWLGPGSSRQPTKGPLYPYMRALWVCSRAIERTRPRRVVIASGDRRLAAMIASQCSSAAASWEFAPGSVHPAASPWRAQTLWLFGSLLSLAVQPLWIVLRWLLARAVAGSPRESASDRRISSVVMSGWFPQHVRDTAAGSTVWYWRALAESLEKGSVPVRARFLLHTNRFRHTGWKRVLSLLPILGWRRLRRVDGLAPIQQTHLELRAFLSALGLQWMMLTRYWRLERTASFQSSFRFAGADVSWLFATGLRRSVADIARWARNVAAVARSLEHVGNVEAVLVHEEFYAKGMLTIAAARRLGIPTVGVQHGTVSPEHLVYCVPAGHVAGAPVPDYFAAYGQFAKDSVSRAGCYPAERVWIAGGPRFDHLAVRRRSRADARAALGLPPAAFVILLATQRYEWSGRPAEALFQAVAGQQDMLVCVKTHPNEKAPERYLELAKRCGAENIVNFSDRFDELLAACDVLVSRSSTTLLEAILADKPTICVNFPDEPDRYPYVADGGSLGAASCAEVQAALGEIRDGRAAVRLAAARQAFLRKHLGPTCDGQSAATFAALVTDAFIDRKAGLARCA